MRSLRCGGRIHQLGADVGQGSDGASVYDRGIFAEELPVSKRDAPRAVDPDHVLVVLPYLDHNASSVPFCRVGSHLILDAYKVSYFQGRQVHCMLG